MSAALEAMGYGICYVGALRNRLPDVDALLKLPPGVFPLFAMSVGVAVRDRRPGVPMIPNCGRGSQ